jgi:hypothetical protein
LYNVSQSFAVWRRRSQCRAARRQVGYSPFDRSASTGNRSRLRLPRTTGMKPMADGRCANGPPGRPSHGDGASFARGSNLASRHANRSQLRSPRTTGMKPMADGRCANGPPDRPSHGDGARKAQSFGGFAPCQERVGRWVVSQPCGRPLHQERPQPATRFVDSCTRCVDISTRLYAIIRDYTPPLRRNWTKMR